MAGMARIQIRFEVDELGLIIDLLRGEPLDGMQADRQEQASVMASYLTWRAANFFTAPTRTIRRRYAHRRSDCGQGSAAR